MRKTYDKLKAEQAEIANQLTYTNKDGDVKAFAEPGDLNGKRVIACRIETKVLLSVSALDNISKWLKKLNK